MLGLILQARMGSTRLPGKVLRPLLGRPLLGVICDRLARRRCGGQFVVATTTLPQDDTIEAFCRAEGVACFRGDPLDVLDRYYRCALAFGFDPVVRLTGDNPFVDVEEVDRLVALQVACGAPFSHSFAPLPIGVGAEVFSFAALAASHAEGHEPQHREHVDEFLIENPDRFPFEKLLVPAAKRQPHVRLTVDTEEDFRRAERIIAACGPYATTEQAIAQCLQSA
jgi:spore coat polysaccharide biosynthesis protein SpsF